jgi:hypothetical protein
VQSNQERCDLRVAALSGQDFGHHGTRLIARERLAVVGKAMEDVSDHFRLPSYRSRDILSNPLALASSVEASVKAFTPARRQALDLNRAFEQFDIRSWRSVEMVKLGNRQAGDFPRENLKFVSGADFAFLDH